VVCVAEVDAGDVAAERRVGLPAEAGEHLPQVQRGIQHLGRAGERGLLVALDPAPSLELAQREPRGRLLGEGEHERDLAVGVGTRLVFDEDRDLADGAAEGQRREQARRDVPALDMITAQLGAGGGVLDHEVGAGPHDGRDARGAVVEELDVALLLVGAGAATRPRPTMRSWETSWRWTWSGPNRRASSSMNLVRISATGAFRQAEARRQIAASSSGVSTSGVGAATTAFSRLARSLPPIGSEGRSLDGHASGAAAPSRSLGFTSAA